MSHRLTYTQWSTSDLALLSRYWPDRHEADIVALFSNRYTLVAVRSKAHAMRLKKSSAYRSGMVRRHLLARHVCSRCGKVGG